MKISFQEDHRLRQALVHAVGKFVLRLSSSEVRFFIHLLLFVFFVHCGCRIELIIIIIIIATFIIIIIIIIIIILSSSS